MLARSLLPADGPWALAAVFHDLLYRTNGTGRRWKNLLSQGGISRSSSYSRAEADLILLQAMEDLAVPWLQRTIIWAAVRLGGGAGWGH